MTALRVALTFDAEHPDRPSEPGITERLLETLASDGITATFFVQGRWAEACPAVARQIADAGHVVGNHSHYHARMSLLTDQGLATDLADAANAIEAATGVDPRPWFRCPFGAGADDPRVQAGIELAGYRHVGWDVSAEDWQPGLDGPAIEAAIVDGTLAHGDGAVVLLHAWPSATLAAVPGVIARLRDAGARFVTIGELATIPTAPNWI